MEANNQQSLDIKYHKLASEYSKIRAQANVLKRALLDEQSKSANLREALRQRDASLRRAEQEVDSLGFRNKQLEQRVSSLQDLHRENKQISTKIKGNKTNNGASVEPTNNDLNESIFGEELKRKILENAQLTSMISDKDNDIQLMTDRISDFQQQINKLNFEHNEVEQKLRREIESLVGKSAVFEAKWTDGSSIMGSDDALSVSESESTPTHHHQNSTDVRVMQLERELLYCKAKYDMLKVNKNLDDQFRIQTNNQTSFKESKSNTCEVTPSTGPDKSTTEPTAENMKEQLIYNKFCTQLDDLFEQKCVAESKTITFMTECTNLQHNLDLLSNELIEKEQQYLDSQKSWQVAEEDLATTRINYEEQIGMLTEQVISLSDQLAALK